jgi:hypothetical protein
MLRWMLLGGSVVMILWLIAADHSKSMELCEQSFSRDTCWEALQ